MTITGKFTRDDNFTTIYTADTMYPDLFRQWKAECTEEGTFHLSEN